jgi:hypothetical protein
MPLRHRRKLHLTHIRSAFSMVGRGGAPEVSIPVAELVAEGGQVRRALQHIHRGRLCGSLACLRWDSERN